ncbi:hypothetical protein ABEB36_007701 [Hypothenemus hampei]|uniref:Uncharacterized protein n=1 Tax=Hypothenemus hampei TaxID=57062 RepID=A0ABD1EUU6_HYPHA
MLIRFIKGNYIPNEKMCSNQWSIVNNLNTHTIIYDIFSKKKEENKFLKNKYFMLGSKEDKIKQRLNLHKKRRSTTAMMI